MPPTSSTTNAQFENMNVSSTIPQGNADAGYCSANPCMDSLPSVAEVTDQAAVKRAGIYKYTSTAPIFAAAWSGKPITENQKFRLAVGTIVEHGCGSNKVSIIGLDRDGGRLVEGISMPLQFAANRIVFIPDIANNHPDLLAISTDCVRIHRIGEDGRKFYKECTLRNSGSRNKADNIPTSFDWNEVDQRLIGVSNLDSTCSIFDIEVGKAVSTKRTCTVKRQLVTHDSAVHDIAFSRMESGKDIFATVGADGTARVFDLRSQEPATIIHSSPQNIPLMRLAWNKQLPSQVAIMAEDSLEVNDIMKNVAIFDVRKLGRPIRLLNNHSGPVNGIAWPPNSSARLCTVADNQALIWENDITSKSLDDTPTLAYTAGGEVNHVVWGVAHDNWISICFQNTLEILRV